MMDPAVSVVSASPKINGSDVLKHRVQDSRDLCNKISKHICYIKTFFYLQKKKRQLVFMYLFSCLGMNTIKF